MTTASWKPDLCIYHANCMDGFGAAWAVWRRWGDDVEYVPASYGNEPPDVTGKHVLMVDFSYKRPTIDRMAEQAASIIILDHHESAEKELADWTNRVVRADAENVARLLARVAGPPQNVLVEFDMRRSGAILAWDFCFGEAPPLLLRYIEDRDLWRFRMPNSRAVNAYLAVVEQGFDVWERLAEDLGERGHRIAADLGSMILRQREKDIAALLAASTRLMMIGGHEVPVANVPFMWASDAGNILAVGRPFAATYYDRADGTRAFSLRSAEGGLNVAEIAASYGGGGHRHAAGFQAPKGWEGHEVL